MIYEIVTVAVVAVLAFGAYTFKRKESDKIPFSKRLQDSI